MIDMEYAVFRNIYDINYIFISKDILVTNPNVKWSDIKGLSMPKKLLDEAIVLPTKYPEIFTGLCTPWTAMLFYGPPGTGTHIFYKSI